VESEDAVIRLRRRMLEVHKGADRCLHWKILPWREARGPVSAMLMVIAR
jgi:hypothetical protein